MPWQFTADSGSGQAETDTGKRGIIRLVIKNAIVRW